jgi:hypothetical protein
MTAHRTMRMLLALTMGLGGLACASIVGIEDITLVRGPNGAGGAAGDAARDAAGDDDDGATGDACKPTATLAPCNAPGGIRGKATPGEACSSACFCAADFCITAGSTVGVCGAGRACGQPCTADHDCASLSCGAEGCR